LERNEKRRNVLKHETPSNIIQAIDFKRFDEPTWNNLNRCKTLQKHLDLN